MHKGKLLILAYFLCSIGIYAQEMKREVSVESRVKLLILTDRHEESKKLIAAGYPADSYEYFYLNAFLMEDMGEYKIANEYYQKAFEIRETNDAIFGVINTDIQRRKYKEAMEFLTQVEKDPNMDKELLKKLKEQLSKLIDESKYMSVALGVGYSDNIYENDTNEGSITGQMTFNYGKSFNINEKWKVNGYFSYNNEFFMEDESENYHYFYLGSTLEKERTTSTMKIPLSFNYKLKDNEPEEYNVALALGCDRKIKSRYRLQWQIELSYKKNELYDYSGTLNNNTIDFSFAEPFGIVYTLGVNFDFEDYDEETYSKSNYGGKILLKRAVGDGEVSFKAKADYRDYKEADRKESLESYALKYTKPFGGDWDISLEYRYEKQDSDYAIYEYDETFYTVLVSKEF